MFKLSSAKITEITGQVSSAAKHAASALFNSASSTGSSLWSHSIFRKKYYISIPSGDGWPCIFASGGREQLGRYSSNLPFLGWHDNNSTPKHISKKLNLAVLHDHPLSLSMWYTFALPKCGFNLPCLSWKSKFYSSFQPTICGKNSKIFAEKIALSTHHPSTHR